MPALLEALFPRMDPVVATHRSRADAESTVAALQRAGYGRRMLAVVGGDGAAQAASASERPSPSLRASGPFWGLLWALLTIAATRTIPLGGAASGEFLMLGALALVLQVAVAVRAVETPRDDAGTTARGPLQASRAGDDAPDLHFHVLVHGSRSDVALARDILAH